MPRYCPAPAVVVVVQAGQRARLLHRGLPRQGAVNAVTNVHELVAATVASEHAEIEQELQAIGPQQSRAAERAAFPENLRSIRSVTVDFGKGEIVAREFKPGLKRTLGTDIALRLLGVEQLNQYRESQGQPPLPADWTANLEVVEEMLAADQWEVPTPEVLVQLMRKAPHAEVRKLLRELGVKVTGQSATREEYKAIPPSASA